MTSIRVSRVVTQASSQPTSRGMIGRLLTAAVPAILLVGLLAAPVGAAKPQPSATASVSARGCEFVLGYAWSKFSGKGLIATYGLYERVATVDTEVSVQSVPDQVGRTGALSNVITLTADVYPAGRTLVARGVLIDGKTLVPVAGSDVASDPISSTCG